MVHRRRRPSSIDGDSVPRPTARWPKAPRPLPRRTPSATRASEDRNSSGPSASTSVWSPPIVRWITPLDQTVSRTGIAPATRTFDPRARVAGVCASAATASGIRSANRVASRPAERESVRRHEKEEGETDEGETRVLGEGAESVAASRFSVVLASGSSLSANGFVRRGWPAFRKSALIAVDQSRCFEPAPRRLHRQTRLSRSHGSIRRCARARLRGTQSERVASGATTERRIPARVGARYAKRR